MHDPMYDPLIVRSSAVMLIAGIENILFGAGKPTVIVVPPHLVAP